jgi:hypothetical protein
MNLLNMVVICLSCRDNTISLLSFKFSNFSSKIVLYQLLSRLNPSVAASEAQGALVGGRPTPLHQPTWALAALTQGGGRPAPTEA